MSWCSAQHRQIIRRRKSWTGLSNKQGNYNEQLWVNYITAVFLKKITKNLLLLLQKPLIAFLTPWEQKIEHWSIHLSALSVHRLSPTQLSTKKWRTVESLRKSNNFIRIYTTKPRGNRIYSWSDNKMRGCVTHFFFPARLGNDTK